MSNSLFKGKSTHTKIFTAITAAAILLLIVLNVLLTYFGDQGQLFVDTTPEGFYSMTKVMKQSCDDILNSEEVGGKEIKITFCADPDVLEASYELRPTYFMALQLRNRFDNVKVENVNIDYNPSLNTVYRTTSHRELAYTDMIISYDGRYKVTDMSSFWTQNYFSYNGEYRMVSLLASLTAQNSPAAYFVTDYGTTYYDPADKDSEMSVSMSAVAELIEERGLQVKTVSLKDPALKAIPADCALLIINAPTEDFATNPDEYDRFDYVSELELIDRYLKAKSGAVIINKGYDVDLPNLESFTEEWGISFGDAVVTDPKNSVNDDGTAIVGVYDIDSFGGAYYGQYAELSTAPKMVFTNSGYIYNSFAPATAVDEAGSVNTQKTFAEFIYTTDGSKSYASYDDIAADNPIEQSKKALAAASVRTSLDGDTAETTYSYLFCTNSADFFSNDLIGNKSYANSSIMGSVISSISRIDRYASIELGGLSQNSPSYGGKQTQSTTLTESAVDVYSPDAKKIIAVNKAFLTPHKVVTTVFVSLFPVALIVLGVIVSIKRKHL